MAGGWGKIDIRVQAAVGWAWTLGAKDSWRWEMAAEFGLGQIFQNAVTTQCPQSSLCHDKEAPFR